MIGPSSNEEEEVAKAIKGSGFDPKRDAKVSVNIVDMAKQLNGTVEMSD